MGIELFPVQNVAQVQIEKGTVLDGNKFHKMMGRIHKDALAKTSKFYGVKLKGTLEKCSECALAKIRQQNVCKESKVKVSEPGERLHIFTSSSSKLWRRKVLDTDSG
jgi:hypothetical protein